MPERRDLLSVLFPLARELRQIEDEAAAEVQLTMWQYAVLTIIDDVPANQTTLAGRLHYSKNRLVHDIDHLEHLGLVSREVHPADRRSNHITITAKGRRTMKRIQKRIHSEEDALLRHAPSASRQQFLRLAVELVDGMRRPGDAAADRSPAADG